MSLLAHLREERNKIILASITSAIGFFAALFANSVLEQNRERDAYSSMLEAIQVEAAANKDVLTTSFKTFFKEGIVFQQFNTTTASLYLAAPTYLKFSNPSDVANLSQYIRELALSNKYREKVEVLRLENKNEAMAQHIVKSWEINMERVEVTIAAVQTARSKHAR